MTIDDIRTAKHANPFRPFEIVTTDGRALRIEQPIHIALSPHGDSVAGFARNGSFFLMLSQIARLKTPPQAKRKTA